MTLNPECIRDLMLFFEEFTYVKAHKNGTQISASYRVIGTDEICNFTKFSNYDPGEIFYHVIQLAESGYLATDFTFDPAVKFLRNGIPNVYYVTPKGHEFIASIKSKESWVKTSGILKAVKSISLSTMETVAKGVTEALIGQYMANPQV